jgi:hypothetical protein
MERELFFPPQIGAVLFVLGNPADGSFSMFESQEEEDQELRNILEIEEIEEAVTTKLNQYCKTGFMELATMHANMTEGDSKKLWNNQLDQMMPVRKTPKSSGTTNWIR